MTITQTKTSTLTLPRIVEALINRAGGELPLARLTNIERYTFRRIVGKSGGLKTYPTMDTFDRIAEYKQKLDEEGDPLIIEGEKIVLSAPDLIQLCREALADRSDRNELVRMIDTLKDDQITQLLGIARLMVNGNGVDNGNGLNDLERILRASTLDNLVSAFIQNLDIRYPNQNRVLQVRGFLSDFSDSASLEAELLMFANYGSLDLSNPYPILFVLARGLRRVTPKGLGKSFGGDILAMCRFYGIGN